MDRRDFLKTGGIVSAGTACAYALPLLPVCSSIPASVEDSSTEHKKWGMVIDLGKCNECPPDCTACLDACRKENNVADHGNEQWDVHLIRTVTIKRRHSEGSPERKVPVLCNHCDDPPCALACPVQATYKRPDGIVIVDQHRCIGCRYCMIACPYDARYYNYKENDQWPNKDRPRSGHGVPESCTLCAHRLDKDEKPACVEACPSKALVVGDLNDRNSEVSELIAKNSVRALREDLGTKPKVYYIGL